MKRKFELMIPVGIVSLLVIFLVLCLVSFSLLSLSSAVADKKLADKMVNRTTEYYAAVSEANKILADVDEQLLSFRKNVTNKEEYDRMTKDMATDWQIPINDSQVLSVEIHILYPENDGEHCYEITKWQTANTDDWTPDMSQPVYQGQ